MKIVKDKKIIKVIDNNKLKLAMYFVPSFFICEFPTFDKAVVRREDDEVFYSNLEWLMSQSYSFPHEFGMKNENKLVWFSENCYNIENEFEVSNTPRMIIERGEEEFFIYCKRPFWEKNNIIRESLVSFSPAGNGYYCINDSTGSTLQNDMVNVFNSSLNNRIIENDKQLKRINNN